MESAFARTLTAGIKGVAMVLDQEVQPLTSDSTKFGACLRSAGIQLQCYLLSTIYFLALSATLYPKNRDFLCWGVWCLFEFLLSSRQHLELVFVTNAGVIGDATWRKQFCLKVSNHCSFPSITQTASFLVCQCKCSWRVLVPAWVWWGSRLISEMLLKAGWPGGSTCVKHDVIPCFGMWTSGKMCS